ncbi:PepSY domain-containing protein [Lichenifustis flavocetrariae]|uniref:PepSY domain-containing protein n=1 Tax=Lichenifustis flavocetrariae TaxID=2949735 RepID=A0AA41YZF7_9HYPH|nr:hypothetical protein [Lichenifustis flavocetrariae]MCW6506522.1 hypothetical protein [Lichenifustis flavocetrariae]
MSESKVHGMERVPDVIHGLFRARTYLGGMVPGARTAAIAVLGLVISSIGPLRAESERVHACMSPNQARELLITQRLIAPFRAFGEVSRNQPGGDAVGLQLCLYGDVFVYDVTVLRRDGRVSHTMVDAHSGAILAAPHGAK